MKTLFRNTNQNLIARTSMTRLDSEMLLCVRKKNPWVSPSKANTTFLWQNTTAYPSRIESPLKTAFHELVSVHESEAFCLHLLALLEFPFAFDVSKTSAAPAFFFLCMNSEMRISTNLKNKESHAKVRA